MYVKLYWEKDTRDVQISSSYAAYKLGIRDFFWISEYLTQKDKASEYGSQRGLPVYLVSIIAYPYYSKLVKNSRRDIGVNTQDKWYNIERILKKFA